MARAHDASRLRIGFAGTPEFAATILRALIDAARRPRVVYTQPDRPTGRGRRLQPSAVKALALEQDLPLRQPDSLRGDQAAAELAGFALDVLVVAAYGLILPPAILGTPRLGCINVHASLLPRWRGAAPVERAIMAGDRETGVSIMRMERGLDTGPVFLERRCPITRDTDGPALEAQLARLGSEALLDCLHQLPQLKPVVQAEHGVSYAHKLTRADAEIHWNRPADEIERQVRALCGRLPAYTTAPAVQPGGPDPVRVTVLGASAIDAMDAGGADPGRVVGAGRDGIRVACGSGVLNVHRLKLNLGKGRAMSAAEAQNGYPALFAAGVRFGEGHA